jgi:hypothetical protein
MDGQKGVEMAWIERRGWLPEPEKRPEHPLAPPSKPSPAPPETPRNAYCLEYHVLYCPECKGDRVPYYFKRGRIRYHVCTECGCRFKSLQV